MGKVYSTEEVRDGYLPQIENYLVAGRFALDNIASKTEISTNLATAEDCLFKSASIYGSAIDGGPNIRSDLDLLAIHFPGADKENRARIFLDRLASTIKSNYNVALEPQLHPTNAHAINVDPLYAHHVVEKAAALPEWRINDPSEEFKSLLIDEDDKISSTICASRYFICKTLDFEQALSAYVGFANFRVLQRAWEFPSASGRKVLPATTEPGQILPPVRDKPKLKLLVENRIHELFSRDESAVLLQDHQDLANQDRAYTSLLECTHSELSDLQKTKLADSERQTKKNQLVDYYDEWLENAYLPAIKKAERLASAWAILLEDKVINLAPERYHELENAENGLFYDHNDY